MLLMTHISPVRPSWTAWLVAAAVAACVLEGAARKWLFPNSSPAMQAPFYFAKDAILVLAAGSALRYSVRSPTISRMWLWIGVAGLLIVVGGFLAFVEMRPVGALLTLRSLIVLPCLALVIAPGLRSQADLMLIVWTVGILGIGLALL